MSDQEPGKRNRTERLESMIISYGTHHPTIDPDAWVAPDATVSGNVTISAMLKGLAQKAHIL
ncbi:hypothetical protein [Consotaella aegiceratis]|uniref:hypothetical protein n=1 Tax=Consotaella aegiceratis TaxID=3097961 RepID=UPI002F3ED0AB